MKYLFYFLIFTILWSCSRSKEEYLTTTINYNQSFNIQTIDIIPWHEQQFPKYYQEVGFIKPESSMTVRDIVMPTLRQNGGELWLGDAERTIRIADRSIQNYRHHTIVLPDGSVYLDFPHNTIRQINIIREDATGTKVWKTQTEAIPINDQGYANLIADQGSLYFQFNQIQEQQATCLWRLDPATGALEQLLDLPAENYSPIWIHEGIAYWQAHSMIVAYDLATHQQSDHATYPQRDMREFRLITPLPNHALFFVSANDVLWTDQQGKPIARHPISNFMPTGFDQTTMKIDLYQAMLQPDGSLIYPAITEEGIHLLQLTWQ